MSTHIHGFHMVTERNSGPLSSHTPAVFPSGRSRPPPASCRLPPVWPRPCRLRTAQLSTARLPGDLPPLCGTGIRGSEAPIGLDLTDCAWWCLVPSVCPPRWLPAARAGRQTAPSVAFACGDGMGERKGELHVQYCPRSVMAPQHTSAAWLFQGLNLNGERSSPTLAFCLLRGPGQ